MGRCVKCGRETPHVYAYWTGDLLEPKRRKTCVNVQKHTAFLCTKCATAELVIFYAVSLAMWVTMLVRLLLTPPNLIGIIIGYSMSVALFLGAFLYALTIRRKDKKLPFYASKELAEKRIVKTLRKQNPGKKYFAPSAYH